MTYVYFFFLLFSSYFRQPPRTVVIVSSFIYDLFLFLLGVVVLYSILLCQCSLSSFWTSLLITYRIWSSSSSCLSVPNRLW